VVIITTLLVMEQLVVMPLISMHLSTLLTGASLVEVAAVVQVEILMVVVMEQAVLKMEGPAQAYL